MGRGGALTRTQLRAQIQNGKLTRKQLWAPRWMLAAHAFQCVGDRSWGLFLPLYLAELRPGSVAPVAVIEVVRYGFGMLFATKVAEWCETQGHSKVLRRLLICENLGVVLGALLSRAALGDLGNPAFWAAAVFFWRRRRVFFSLTNSSWESCRAVPILVHPSDAPRGDERATR